MNLLLDQKVALITGSAQGLGKSIAEELAQEGCRVIIADLNLEMAEVAASELRQRNLVAYPVETDVSDVTSVTTTVDYVEQSIGSIDILVNNAGIIKTGAFRDSSVEDWEQVSRVNLSSVYYCCKSVLPGMAANEYGKIVNIASVSASRGGGAIGNVLYGTTKAGVVAMTRGLARELAPLGINVNAINPAVIETSMTKNQLTTEAKERIVDAIPMGRLGTGSEIGSLTAFLASDISSFITGETIAVDGGYLNA